MSAELPPFKLTTHAEQRNKIIKQQLNSVVAGRNFMCKMIPPPLCTGHLHSPFLACIYSWPPPSPPTTTQHGNVAKCTALTPYVRSSKGVDDFEQFPLPPASKHLCLDHTLKFELQCCSPTVQLQELPLSAGCGSLSSAPNTDGNWCPSPP